MLREKLRFTVDDLLADEPAVTVADAYGDVGVDFAVNIWLATEEAAPYRPAPPREEGPLLARLRALRGTMQ